MVESWLWILAVESGLWNPGCGIVVVEPRLCG